MIPRRFNSQTNNDPPPARRTEPERAAYHAEERDKIASARQAAKRLPAGSQSAKSPRTKWPDCLGYGPLQGDKDCAECECKAFCGLPQGQTPEVRSKRKIAQRRFYRFFVEVHQIIYGSKAPNLYAHNDLPVRIQVNCLRRKTRPELFLLCVLLCQHEQDPQGKFELHRLLREWNSYLEVWQSVIKEHKCFDVESICDYFDYHHLIDKFTSLLHPIKDATVEEASSPTDDGQKTHLFNRAVAAALKRDAEAAILYRHVRYWCETNESQKKQHNFHQRRYWTYNTLDALHKKFPYISRSTIYSKLRKLEEAGYVVLGNFNRAKMDKTRWYSARFKDRDGEEIDGEPNIGFVVEEATRFGSVVQACVLYLIRRRITKRLDKGLEGQVMLGTDDFCSFLPFTRRTIRRAIVQLLQRPEVGLKEVRPPGNYPDDSGGMRRRDRRLNPRIYSLAFTGADESLFPETACQIETSVDQTETNCGPDETDAGHIKTVHGQTETTIPMNP